MARKRIIPLYDETKLGINPFIAGNFKIKAVTVVNKRKIADVTDILENQDGIISNVTEQHYTTVLEKNTYCKLFDLPALRIHIGSLSSRARDLLLWIMYEIEPGKDVIFINYERYCTEFNVSPTTYYEAVNDLMKGAVISPTVVKTVYWINPVLLFKGNRIKKYPEHINIVNQ